MELLYVSNEYPPDTGFGGIGTYTAYMAETMAARGHSVHVICRSADGTPHQLDQNGVTVHRISPGTHPLPPSRLLYPLRKLCYSWIPHMLDRLAWTREVLRTYGSLRSQGLHVDLVEFPECGGEGYALTRGATARTVARLHTPWQMVSTLDRLDENRLDTRLIATVERSSVRKATAVTSPTQALADRLHKQWRLPKQPIVFPNPIPAQSFARTAGGDWIYVGRVEHRKGVHVLLQAYRDLGPEAPALRIVGRPYGRLRDGTDYGDHIRRTIDQYRLSERIEWIEGVSPLDVRKYLAQSSVAILPSLWENLPYTCLEAMASGLTVVASRCGGFPEIITDGENGFLCEPDNPASLTSVLQELVSDPECIRRVGDRARESVVQRYDCGRIGETAESVYSEIVGD